MPAAAQTLTPGDVVPVDETRAAALVVPAAGKGEWRLLVQTVWDSSTSQLQRRVFKVFDPFAAQDFDLFWEPFDPAVISDAPVSGDGVLTWREAGGLRYGREGLVAQYRGTLHEGRPQGRGTFVERSGLRYDGGWQAGLMHGQGDLRHASGDVYSGGFQDGLPHGEGTYVSAAGETYVGAFRNGRRHGAGQVLLPSGVRFSGTWRNDRVERRETDGITREFAQLHDAQARVAPAGLFVSLSVGGGSEFCCFVGPPQFGYTALSRSDRLEIVPDAPFMMDVWRGRANIVIQNPRRFDWDRAGLGAYNFLNYNKHHIKTVPLRFGLENREDQGLVQIIGGYLEIDRSRVDRQPKLQATVLKPLSRQSLGYSIENFGWGPATSARLVAHFVDQQTGGPGAEFETRLGELDGVGEFSFAPMLQAYGLAPSVTAGLETRCGDQERDACMAMLRSAGELSGIRQFLLVDNSDTNQPGSHFGVRARGHVTYDWVDDDGGTQQTRAPFEGFVPLGSLRLYGECEGGVAQQIAGGRPFALAERGDNYRIPFPLNFSVAPGELARWEILLDADKSSQHLLRVVLQLADGREVPSRDISLLTFRPRTFPASVRAFEPRC